MHYNHNFFYSECSHCRVTYTGHSNGGAQAIIAALEHSLNSKLSERLSIRRVITWAGASGLYGNAVKRYNEVLGDKTLQIVNAKDFLATLIDSCGVHRVAGALMITSSSNEINADPHDR
jgi:hypothetical protein